MERGELEAAVARAIHEAACCDEPGAWDVPRWHKASDAAIRVVLAEAQRCVEALPGRGWADAAGAGEDMRQAVLVVLAGLVPQPLV